MWVTNVLDTKIYAYNLSTKARDASKDFNTLSAAGNTSPYDLWSDGTTMWVVDPVGDKIYAYNLSTKAEDTSKDFNSLSTSGNNDPTGIWSDGTTMWVADLIDNKIYAYNLHYSNINQGGYVYEVDGSNNPTGIIIPDAGIYELHFSIDFYVFRIH